MKKQDSHYAWFILLGVILIRGFAGGGLNTTSGLFLPPVSQELNVGIGALSIYFSITSIVTVFWLPFAGKLINRYDIRVIAVTGAVLQTFSFMAFGLLNQVYGWYILSIPYAMGATILTSLLGPILINRWFSKNAGLMMGIQMAFVGLFGAVFQPIASKIIISQGWRTAYFLIGLSAFLVVILTCLILLRNKPEDKQLFPLGANPPSSCPNRAERKKGIETAEIPEKTAVSSLSFTLLLLFMIAITGIGVFSQHIPNYGLLLGYTPDQTGNALALASVGNAVGSIAIGMISDRIGGLKTCYAMIGTGFLSIAGFLLGQNGFGIFGLSAFLHGLVSSSIMVLAPILTLKFYGRRDYEKIFAKLSMGAPISSILLIPAYGFIFDLTNSYNIVLAAMFCLLAVALLSITLGWKSRCTEISFRK